MVKLYFELHDRKPARQIAWRKHGASWHDNAQLASPSIAKQLQRLLMSKQQLNQNLNIEKYREGV